MKFYNRAALVAAAAFALWSSEAAALQTAPTSIRVGRSCSCSTCSTVSTVSLDTYVKRVLPHEWYSTWHAESLKAGSIAIRSYAGWYCYNPINVSYDICDTTCCQVYGTTQYTSTDNAVNATTGIFLVDGAGRITRSEYSAEANNSGCGNGYTNTCLSDSVCSGATNNGHGRGMCQWGSQRWASTQGKLYPWIVDHYYEQYGWVRANLATNRPDELVIDNASSGFTASSNWLSGTSATTKYGTDYRYRGTAAVSDAANFTANVTKTGTYAVYAWWVSGTNRAPAAPYILPDGVTKTANQQTNGGKFNYLGKVSFSTTGNKTTKLSCWTTTGYIVHADAVKYFGPLP